MFQITTAKRDAFFEYLLEEGLVLRKTNKILEVAPTILLSQSLLISSYPESFRQFLVSRLFKQDYSLVHPTGEVKGVRGIVECEDSSLRIIPDKRGVRSFCSIFMAEPFDTLLIQGQIEEAYNLVRARQYLLFGDVCEKGDRETRDCYNDLIKVVREYNPYGEDYELSHDTDRSSEYYLIRNRTLKKTIR